MSFFDGKKALRHRYVSKLFSDFSGATNATTALHICTFDHGARFMYFDNTIDQEISLLLAAPMDEKGGNPDDPAYRLLWFEIGANRVINYDGLSTMGISIDPGAQLFGFRNGAVSSGKFKIVYWA